LLEARIEIDDSNNDFGRMVCISLIPEIREEERMGRGKVILQCDKGVIIDIKAHKIGDIQALLSSYLGLLKVIFDVYRANL
jgi:tRNA threonylcarbamoyladenosine modification (KEOPS) complex  Pcc1 subunit